MTDIRYICNQIKGSDATKNLTNGMERQTIDTYKLTSMEEPSDEVLSQLMQEAATVARRKSAEAHRLYFLKLQQEVEHQLQQYS